MDRQSEDRQHLPTAINQVYSRFCSKKGASQHPFLILVGWFGSFYELDAYLRSHFDAIAPMAAPTNGLLKNFSSAGWSASTS